MKLVVFGPGHPFRGGIANTTTALVKVLVERGHAVSFISARRQYPSWLYPGSDDRDPAACEAMACAEPLLDPMMPWTWNAAARRALASSADAWIMPYWTFVWAPLWRSLLRRRTRPPVVGVVHNPVDHDAGWIQKRVAQQLLARCDGLFTHAEALADLLREAFPRLPIASHVLALSPPGVLPERARARTALALPRGGKVALFFGLIRPYKGVDLLLEAMAREEVSTDWSLIVAGEAWGDLEAKLRAQVAQSELGARVQLRFGWVPEGDLKSLLAAADLMILPYRSGSQSAVAPLALAHGIPVLSTRVGGLPELIRDGVNGLVVESGSAAALAKALATCDEPTLTRLAQGAHATAQRLSWDSYAARLEELLATVTQQL